MNKTETKTGFEKLQKPSRMRTVLEVEKPKESKQTFKRLLQYFVDERKLLIGLLLGYYVMYMRLSCKVKPLIRLLRELLVCLLSVLD